MSRNLPQHGMVDALYPIVAFARHRWLTLVAVVVAAVLLVLFADTTVANLQRDEAIPRTKVSLLVGGAAASSFMLLVRPILAEPERLAARSMRLTRLITHAGFGVAFLALGALTSVALAPNPGSAWRAVTSAAALMGIAAACAVAGTWWGLLVPWLYLAGGLAFGFERGVGGTDGSVHPWAWLIGNHVNAVGELLVFGIGVALAVLVRPRLDSP